jgi:hypothetical protein
MAFDLSTAAPVASGGFDLSSAQPVPAGVGIPGPRRAWSDVPGEALANVMPSAQKFVGGLYEAVTSPVQTAKGLLDLGAGALQNALPKQVVDFVNKFDANPQAAQQAVQVANAVGGMYKDRYGSIEGIKNTFATDPVGAVADLSTLLSGGAAATGRVAPAASKMLSTAATYTNPTAPISAAAGYGVALTGKAIGNAIDTMQGQRPAVRAGNIVRNALTEEGRAPQNLLAAQMALQNAPPTATVRQALSDVMSPQTQYLGQMVEARTAPGAAESVREAQQAARRANLQAETPDLAAAEAIRSGTAKQLYGIADEALLPGRERQFKPVQTGTTQSGVPMIDPITGQPKMVAVTPADVAMTMPESIIQRTIQTSPQPINVPSSNSQRAIQVEVGRNSFNSPIYETRNVPVNQPATTRSATRNSFNNPIYGNEIVSINQPATKQAITRDFLTNAPKLAQDVSLGGQPIYKQVLAGYKYDPQLAKLMDRPAIQAAFDSAATIAANKGVPMFTDNGQLTGRGAHLVKLAIDDAINPTPGTPIARNAADALRGAKADYLGWVENKVPAYKTARETFKTQSEPVNQAQVLNAMQEVLAAPLGVGERAGAFMTAMGRGEKALLKKATGEPRYTELNQVLTPSQMKVVGEVESELMRDARVAAQTKAGAEAMKIIMDSNKSKVRLPDFMSVKVTLANQMLKILEGRLNQKVMGELENGFKSGTSFVDLMKKVPASERVEVLRALGQAKDQLSPTKLNALGLSANALAPNSENQNALVK